MSVSKKQLKANRQNAQKSTGPKTEEGKRMSSQNAVTHGLHARNVVIDSKHFREDAAEYQALLDSLNETLEPRGMFEDYLVRKIANALWRCDRAAVAETAHITRNIDRAERKVASNIRLAQAFSDDSDFDDDPDIDDDPDSEYFRRRLEIMVATNLVPDENVNANILRYEMRLDRQLTRAYRILLNHQNRRKAMIKAIVPKDFDETRAKADAFFANSPEDI